MSKTKSKNVVLQCMRSRSLLWALAFLSTQPAFAYVCGQAAENKSAQLSCPSGQVISSISFASYGTPTGSCGSFSVSSCNSSTSMSVVKTACVGKASCQVTASNSVFGDPCYGIVKSLAMQATCVSPSPSPSPSPTASPKPSPSPSPSPTASASPSVSSPVITSDASNVTIKFTYSGASGSLDDAFIDSDSNSSTGYSVNGIGANYLLENGNLYKFSGASSTTWGWTSVKAISFTGASGSASWTVARADIGSPSAIRVVGQAQTPSVLSAAVSATLAPLPSPTPSPSPSPSPTSSSQPFTAPALVNPVSPVSYGAKCDGVTDDTAAFQAAVNASDVLVPAGKTCMINNQVSITVSNRHIQCGTGTVLKKAAPNGGRMFNYYSPSGGRLTGDSIVNCSFLGANTMPPQADWNSSTKHWDIPIETQDRVDNFFLAGNTFDRFWGQAMFQTYGAIDGGSGDQIIYNTFKNCAYYGPVFVAHKNGYMGHNTLVDCAAGVENDDANQYTGGNIIEYNTLGCVYGYGAVDMGACAMLTGGCTSNGANYTTNIVRYNVVTGKSNGQGYQPAEGSRLINATQGWAAKGAQYISNTCNNGCVYTP